MTFWDDFSEDLQGQHKADPAGVPHIPTLTVRYEDLCEHPDATLAAILATAGVANRTDGRAGSVPASCGAFQGKNLAHITPRELDAVINITRPTIERYGYGKLVAAQRALRWEMNANIATPWKGNHSPQTEVELCGMECTAAGACPAWHPFYYGRGGESPVSPVRVARPRRS